MRIHEKTLRIRDVLNDLYPVVEPPLDHNSPFQLLVAVVLSASTTDLMVNRVTPALFEAAPTPERMMNLSVAQLQQFIATLGLSQAKAGYLKGLSTQLVELHNGEVPNTREELVALPGVGRKTANVVLSQVFDIPAFAVDTHIKRLAYRWGLTKSKNVNIIERDLCRLFPEEWWNSLHIQLIYFGREYCSAQRHDPEHCPICSFAGVKKRLREERSKRANKK